MLQFGLRHEVYEKQTKVRLRKKCRKTEKKLVSGLQNRVRRFESARNLYNQ